MGGTTSVQISANKVDFDDFVKFKYLLEANCVDETVSCVFFSAHVDDLWMQHREVLRNVTIKHKEAKTYSQKQQLICEMMEYQYYYNISQTFSLICLR